MTDEQKRFRFKDNGVENEIISVASNILAEVLVDLTRFSSGYVVDTYVPFEGSPSKRIAEALYLIAEFERDYASARGGFDYAGEDRLYKRLQRACNAINDYTLNGGSVE